MDIVTPETVFPQIELLETQEVSADALRPKSDPMLASDVTNDLTTTLRLSAPVEGPFVAISPVMLADAKPKLIDKLKLDFVETNVKHRDDPPRNP